MSEIELSDRMTLMNRVINDFILKGENNATKIAKATGIPRKDVVIFQEEWKTIAANDEGIKARASELLTELDRSYDDIIKNLWLSHAIAEDSKAATATLKVIADVIAKRQEILQRAGLYDDAAMGDQLAETEEKIASITELLKSVVIEYPQTKIFIMSGLAKVFNKVEPMPEGGTPAR